MVESRTEKAAEARDHAADLRDDAADERDAAARDRDQLADQRDVEARTRDQESRENRREEADRLEERRLHDDKPTEEDRLPAAAARELAYVFLSRIRDYEAGILADRRAAAEDRRAAAEDRRAAAHDRELAAWSRQQTAVEGAQVGSQELTHPAKERFSAGAAQEVDVAPDSEPPGAPGLERERAAEDSARHAAQLASEIAESERRIAAILESLASQGDPAARERRMAMADRATAGMRTATERGDRLRTLAVRAGEDLAAARLRTLWEFAATTCGTLAETESSIAGALESLAAHETAEAAAEHRRMADEARAAAQAASERAVELRRLERTHNRVESHGGEPGDAQTAADP